MEICIITQSCRIHSHRRIEKDKRTYASTMYVFMKYYFYTKRKDNGFDLGLRDGSYSRYSYFFKDPLYLFVCQELCLYYLNYTYLLLLVFCVQRMNTSRTKSKRGESIESIIYQESWKKKKGKMEELISFLLNNTKVQ